jgi:hypothetical protein
MMVPGPLNGKRDALDQVRGRQRNAVFGATLCPFGTQIQLLLWGWQPLSH